MRWRGGRLSTNVEDQRGRRGLPIIGGGLGTLLLLLLIYLLGGDINQDNTFAIADEDL